jgi:hypothetical protein
LLTLIPPGAGHSADIEIGLVWPAISCAAINRGAPRPHGRQ